jgi:hypothetical protein
VPSRPCCEGHPEGRNQRSDGLAAGHVDRVLNGEVGRSSSAEADQALGSLYLDIGKGSFNFRRFSVTDKRTMKASALKSPSAQVKRRGPPNQLWRSFLRNHAPDIAAVDLFVIPTIGFDLLLLSSGWRAETSSGSRPSYVDCGPWVSATSRLPEARLGRTASPRG